MASPTGCNSGDSLATAADIDYALNQALEVDVMVYYLSGGIGSTKLDPGTYGLSGVTNGSATAGVTCSISPATSCYRTIDLGFTYKNTSGITTVGYLCLRRGSAVALKNILESGSGFGESLKGFSGGATTRPLSPIPPPCTSPIETDCQPEATPNGGTST